MAKTIAVADEAGTTGLDRLKSGPNRLMDFLKDVRAEMRKVVSPSRAEVQSTTIVVLVTVFIFAARSKSCCTACRSTKVPTPAAGSTDAASGKRCSGCTKKA